MTAPTRPRLRTCVWELTLACNASCIHCGSSAGTARPDELTTSESLELIDELSDLGCESITLSGGEPLLRRDWPRLAAAIRGNGMRLEMITNGLAVVDQARAIAGQGFCAVTVSIDGPADVHDQLRGTPHGLRRILEGIAVLAEHQVRIGAVTQVNRRNIHRLRELHEILVEHGVQGWQVQRTVALGRAAQVAEDLCLGADELPLLEATLVDLILDGRIFVQAADNIGYMSRHEPLLRAGTGQPSRFWRGCQAGIQVVGVASDGWIRGCLSLPPAFDEANLRQRRLTEIWADPDAFRYNRRWDDAVLPGRCGTCALGQICRGGCRSLAHAAAGQASPSALCLRQPTPCATEQRARPGAGTV